MRPMISRAAVQPMTRVSMLRIPGSALGKLKRQVARHPASRKAARRRKL